MALVGASGNIGQRTLVRLIEHAIHDITVIVRPESLSQFPPEAAVTRLSFDDKDAIIQALRGREVLILQLGMGVTEYHKCFIEAAAEAGVKYIFPTEFGSDPEAKLVLELPEIIAKQEARDLIESLGVSRWVGVITNPWYDYCLSMGDVLGIDIKSRRATLWDGGQTKMSLSTLQQAATAVAELAATSEDHLAQYANKCFYVTSFQASQRDILKSIMLATDTTEKDWDIRDELSKDVISKANAMTGMDAHVIMLAKFFPLHFQEGLGGNFHDKVNDMQSLGMSEESFDSVTAVAVGKLGS